MVAIPVVNAPSRDTTLGVVTKGLGTRVVIPQRYQTSEAPSPQGVVTKISGPRFGETKVLALAHTYEQATAWQTRRPPLL